MCHFPNAGEYFMANRLFNVAAICSTAAFCASLAGCLLAGSVDPARQFLSLGRGCHTSIDVRSSDPRLEIFNDATYGPYRGSIIEVTAPGHPSQVKSAEFDFLGIYYRHIRWPNGATLWTLSISLVYFAVMSAVLPIVWIVRRSRRPRRGFPVDGQPAGE